VTVGIGEGGVEPYGIGGFETGRCGVAVSWVFEKGSRIPVDVLRRRKVSNLPYPSPEVSETALTPTGSSRFQSNPSAGCDEPGVSAQIAVWSSPKGKKAASLAMWKVSMMP
jgi:hypothetical protein